jgi:hypothetical protein
MDSVPLQVTIAGFGQSAGGAETLFGEFSFAVGVLLIDDSRTERAGVQVAREDDSVVLANVSSLVDHDVLFKEENLRDAIACYFNLNQRGQLRLDDAMARHTPAGKIEPDGMDDRGRKYRIAPDISNGQLAVIAMCWLASRQQGVAGQLESFEDVPDIEVMTIGLPPEFQARATRSNDPGSWYEID